MNKKLLIPIVFFSILCLAASTLIDLAHQVKGTLPVANGGTGVTSSTGTVANVLSTSPTLVTPVIGAATGTSLGVSGALSTGANGGAAGLLNFLGSTSGTATLTAPAIAGTVTNPFVSSNVIQGPAGGTAAAPTFQLGTLNTGLFGTNTIGFALSGAEWMRLQTNELALSGSQPVGWGTTVGAMDTALSRCAAGYTCVGTGAAASTAAYIKTAHTVSLSADWTCGTGGTVSSCVAATIVGSTATPLTFTLPLSAANWSFECDLVVGQATAATANQWNILTATNGVTNTTASYTMATAATAFAAGAVTDQASTTTTFQIAPSWTLGGTATKMPVHIAGTLTGVSASGTVFSLQLVAPTVGDLVTIYEGSKCSLNP